MSPFHPNESFVRQICLVIGCAVAVYVLFLFTAFGAPLRVGLTLFLVTLVITNGYLWWTVSSSKKDAKNHLFPPDLTLVGPHSERLFGTVKDVQRVAAIIAPKFPIQPHKADQAFEVVWLSRRHGVKLFRRLLLPGLAEVALVVLLVGYYILPFEINLRNVRGGRNLSFLLDHFGGFFLLIIGAMVAVACSAWRTQYLSWRYRFVVTTLTQALLVTALPWYLASLLDTDLQRVDLFRIDDVRMHKSILSKNLRLNVGTVGINVPGEMDKDLNDLRDVPYPERLQDTIEAGRTHAIQTVGLTKYQPYIGD